MVVRILLLTDMAATIDAESESMNARLAEMEPSSQDLMDYPLPEPKGKV